MGRMENTTRKGDICIEQREQRVENYCRCWIIKYLQAMWETVVFDFGMCYLKKYHSQDLLWGSSVTTMLWIISQLALGLHWIFIFLIWFFSIRAAGWIFVKLFWYCSILFTHCQRVWVAIVGGNVLSHMRSHGPARCSSAGWVFLWLIIMAWRDCP